MITRTGTLTVRKRVYHTFPRTDTMYVQTGFTKSAAVHSLRKAQVNHIRKAFLAKKLLKNVSESLVSLERDIYGQVNFLPLAIKISILGFIKMKLLRLHPGGRGQSTFGPRRLHEDYSPDDALRK